jgi:hypothetical protein
LGCNRITGLPFQNALILLAGNQAIFKLAAALFPGSMLSHHPKRDEQAV